MTVTLSAWWLLFASVPVLMLGEAILKRFNLLSRYNMPVPVVGGLSICFLFLISDLSGFFHIVLSQKVSTSWWTWLVTPEPEWRHHPEKAINLPFLIGFFTCIGLNATWDTLKKGSWQVPLFLSIATLLAILQNALGMGIALIMGENPLLGVICGSMSQTGGHGTALGFAETLSQAGYSGAASIGAAAATFGLVLGGLMGGPIAALMIRKKQLAPLMSRADARHAITEHDTNEPGIRLLIKYAINQWPAFVAHVLLLMALIKAGAWVSFALQQTGMIFPAYMGAMMVGVIVRNVLEALGTRWIDSKTIEVLSGLTLGIFLVTAMMSLNLKELSSSAGPMLVILFAQLTLTAFFVFWLTYPLMGKNYDAAVIVAGHCGFAHGATPSAVANMDAICLKHGYSKQAFLVVPIVGGMLIDLTNSINITWFINLLK